MIDHTIIRIYTSNISTILIAIPVIILIWSVIGALLFKWMRIIGAVTAAVVIVTILHITVFSRGENGIGSDLVPFSSFERAKIQPEMYRSMLMNVFLFVPLGLSMPYVFGGSTIRRILLTILIGFLLTATVEAIQYFGHLGMAETDDVICNTLGTALGSCAYLLSLLWRKLITSIRRIMNDKRNKDS